MNTPRASAIEHPPRPARRKLSRDTVFLVGDLLPLFDFVGVLLAAHLATLIFTTWITPGIADLALADGIGRAALAAAVLAPLIICDRSFVDYANGGQVAALIRCYAVRFLMFAGVVVAIGMAGRFLADLPSTWLAFWLVGSLLVTALTRGLLLALLRRLERLGILTESIAVIGAGPVADRLIAQLLRTRRSSVELLGVFDDRRSRSDQCVHRPIGSIADLIELGKSRPLDRILLAYPDPESPALKSTLHRLKSLAVPVCLYSQSAGASLSETPLRGRESLRAWAKAGIAEVLPRWVFTLVTIPQRSLAAPVVALRSLAQRSTRPEKLAFTLDDYDLDRFTPVAAKFGQQRFGYVVTPNADHLIRLHREPSFRALYADAAYVLLDSRFISHLLRLTQKLRLPVCTGSDLTAKLFGEVIAADDTVVLVGGSAEQAQCLRERHGLKRFAHFNPPMGFIHDSAAVEDCLRFVEAHSPFRYCLLAVGAPQQERIAQLLKMRGVARGLALCIGASINFLTGEEQRAPLWMQRSGLEWLFRLLQAPGRMASRYLIRGPQLFALLRQTRIVMRATPAGLHAVAPTPMPTPAMAVSRTAVRASPRRSPAAMVPVPGSIRAEHGQHRRQAL